MQTVCVDCVEEGRNFVFCFARVLRLGRTVKQVMCQQTVSEVCSLSSDVVIILLCPSGSIMYSAVYCVRCVYRIPETKPKPVAHNPSHYTAVNPHFNSSQFKTCLSTDPDAGLNKTFAFHPLFLPDQCINIRLHTPCAEFLYSFH